jgi:hypothetical protein
LAVVAEGLALVLLLELLRQQVEVQLSAQAF